MTAPNKEQENKEMSYCILKKSKWNNVVVNGKQLHTKDTIFVNARGSVIWLIFHTVVSESKYLALRLEDQTMTIASYTSVRAWSVRAMSSGPKLNGCVEKLEGFIFKNKQHWSVFSLNRQPTQLTQGNCESFQIIPCHEYTFCCSFHKMQMRDNKRTSCLSQI